MRLFLLLLICNVCYAGEGTFLKYNVNAHPIHLTDVKGLALGYQHEISLFETKLEGGFWNDSSGRSGAKGSGFGQVAIGVEPEAGSFYLNFFQGLGFITTPDSQLGGMFQFFESMGFGIRDQKSKVSVGPTYTHISSAGLEHPNEGRDLMGIQIMIPW